MNVLSNKEIFIILKILSDKKIKNGVSSILVLDKSFTLAELEHVQHEISEVETKSPDEIFTIEPIYKHIFGQNIPSGYALNIGKFNIIAEYAVKYIDAFIHNNIKGLTPNTKFSTLMKGFYNITKGQKNPKNYVTHDLTYIPIFLFAYTNNLIKIKHLTLRTYKNVPEESSNETLAEGIVQVQITVGGVTSEAKINLGMDMDDFSEVLIAFNINGQKEEISADFLKQIIAKIKQEKTPQLSDNDYKDILKRDFKLNDTEINILCACEYLMENSIDNITNKSISKYLQDSGSYILSEGSIKQNTISIKNKCSLPETRGGIVPLVQALQVKGYIIPPLQPSSKP